MDSIASYLSCDSENDSSDSQVQDEVALKSKGQNSKQELQAKYSLPLPKLSFGGQSFPSQNIQSKKCQTVSPIGNKCLLVSPVSRQCDSCIMSLSDDNLHENNSVKFKRYLGENDPVSVVSTKDAIKPYIPKSKRIKVSNEPEVIGKRIYGPSINTQSKLSTIFKKAQLFSQSASLHYKVPKGQVVDFEGHQSCVNRISWNPCFADFLLSASMDSMVSVWNVQTSPFCVHRVQSHKEAVKDAKWNCDGLQILSCGYDKTARINDINSGEEVCKLNHSSFVTCVQYHPTDPNIFLSGTSNDGIFAWDIRTQKFICWYKSFFGQIQDLAFFPDGQSFISAAEILKRNSTDKGIMVWDYKTSTILSNQVFQEAYTCTGLQLHPSDNTFLAQCNAGYVAVFSQKSPYKLNKYKRFEGHQVSGYHIGLHISPDGTLVASGSANGAVFVYNYRTSNLMKTFSLHSQPCMDVAWSPVIPSLLASCDWNGRISLCR